MEYEPSAYLKFILITYCVDKNHDKAKFPFKFS